MAPDLPSTADVGAHVCCSCCRKPDDGPTPTPRLHATDNQSNTEADSCIQPSIEAPPPSNSNTSTFVPSSSSPHIVYIVTDTRYPTSTSFQHNIGTTTISSVHSNRSTANARAKKVVYDNDHGCTVDLDKIIEEVKQGLYTGIGVGGKEGKEGGEGIFARKCEVEERRMDEDSDSEDIGMDGGSGRSDSMVDGVDGDVEMG